MDLHFYLKFQEIIGKCCVGFLLICILVFVILVIYLMIKRIYHHKSKKYNNCYNCRYCIRLDKYRYGCTKYNSEWCTKNDDYYNEEKDIKEHFTKCEEYSNLDQL